MTTAFYLTEVKQFVGELQRTSAATADKTTKEEDVRVHEIIHTKLLLLLFPSATC